MNGGEITLKTLLVLMMVAALGCDDELECSTTVECSDERESFCDPPSVEELKGGETVELRSCTYITYEHCFEKTVCKEIER